MASSSALRSGIKNYARYLNVLSGTEPYVAPPVSSYDLLETTILTGTQATVTFSSLNSTYGSTYQHLQMRISARTTRASVADILRINFNSDTGSNYSMHQLWANGTGVYSYAQSSLTYTEAERVAGGNTTADDFGGMVLDILDPFSSSKNTTIRALSGIASNYFQVTLSSGAWYNTAAITTMDLTAIGSYVAGSRFSLYGLKAA